MRTFVLRARAAPTDSRKLLASVGTEAHAEILAHTLMNAVFVAQSHRADVVVYLVLESTADYSRTIRFDAKPEKAGRYEVRIAYQPHENRGTTVPVVVKAGDKEVRSEVNMKEKPPVEGGFFSLGFSA